MEMDSDSSINSCDIEKEFIIRGKFKKEPTFDFNINLEKVEKLTQDEMQAARIVDLRKALTYLKETDWQYEPIEKHIGQS